MSVAGMTTRSLSGEDASEPASGPYERPAALLLGSLVLVLWLAVVPPSGGYFPRSWYPAALGSVLLFCVTCVACRRLIPSSRAARAALGLFAALVAWAFLSLTWAGSNADAWATANQLVLYFAAAGVAALVPWTPRTLALVAGLWSLGVAILCAARLITWLGATDLTRFFTVDGRLNDPIGYPNATAGLPALALSPAALPGSARTIPAAVRAVALPVAVFLAEFAVLPESRGAILGALLAIPVLLAFAPDRGRLLVRLAVIAALVAPAASSLVAFGSAPENDKPPGPALDHAATWMITSVAVALLLGIALAMLDGRVLVSRAGPRVTRRAIAVALALAVVLFAGLAA